MIKNTRVVGVAAPLLLVLLTLFLAGGGDETAKGERGETRRAASIRSQAEAVETSLPGEFQRWITAYRNGGKAASLTEGMALAKERRTLLKRLIKQDPEKALAIALPEEKRAALPQEITDLLEIPIATAAKFERVVTCGGPPIASGRMPGGEETFVVFDQKRYRAFTFGRRKDLHSKDRISLQGIALDEMVAFSPDPVKRLSEKNGLALEVFGEKRKFTDQGELDRFVARLISDEEAPGPAGLPKSGKPKSLWTEGNKRILYFRVRFADEADDSEPISLYDARINQLAVQRHFRMASYGKLNLTTVFPPVIQLSENREDYWGEALGRMMDEAKSLAIAMGEEAGEDWDYRNYDFHTIVSSGRVGNYRGQAFIGGRESHLQNGFYYLKTAGHELGHNLGLSHAYYNYTSDLSPRGNTPTRGLGRVEYGHRFSLMNALSGLDFTLPELPHFTVHEKWRLDWLEEDEILELARNEDTGNYRLYQYDHEEATGLKAIQLPSGGDLPRYWLAYRSAWRPENRGSNNDNLLNGVLFNWTGTGGGVSTLLDMTPYSQFDRPRNESVWNHDDADKWDAALVIGCTYTDPESGVSVTPMGRGGSPPNEYLDLYIHFSKGKEITLVADDAPCRAIIPEATTAEGTAWTAPDYDDQNWPLSGRQGVGYDTGANYLPYLGLEVPAMRSTNESCFIRIPFVLEEEMETKDLRSLSLALRYDDGFVAYLNGVEIARDRAPTSLAWDSGATRVHRDANAEEFVEFSVDPGLKSLRAGKNVLAIHGLNRGRDSSDFLMQARLVATAAGPANDAPEVSLSASTIFAELNEEVEFTAVGSDPDGDTLVYSWDVSPHYNWETFMEVNYGHDQYNASTITRKFERHGLFVVTVTCSDRKGGVARDRVMVRVGTGEPGGVVRGQVLVGGEPLAGARVFDERGLQSVTAADGSYLLTGEIEGIGTIRASYDGEVFLPSVPMPVRVDSMPLQIDFRGHGNPPSGASDSVLTISPGVAEVDLFTPLPMEASIWDRAVEEEILIPFGATWLYHDRPENLAEGWFDGDADVVGPSGPAPLGYGGQEVTEISYGDDPDQKSGQAFFRRVFNVAAPDEVSSAKLTVRRDDGVVIYLNGSEVARDNVPRSSERFRQNAVLSPVEEIPIEFALDPAVLVEGDNVLVARVDQAEPDSSDLLFDLELVVKRQVAATPATWTVEPTGATVNVDGLFEATETGVYTVTAQAGGLSAVSTVTVPSDSEVSIATFDAFIWENDPSEVRIRVTRSRDSPNPLVVPLVIGGSAENGVDYTRVPSQVTIPGGAVSTDFLFSPRDDDLAEGIETLKLTIGASPVYLLGDSPSVTVTLIDNENRVVGRPDAGDDRATKVGLPITLAGRVLGEEEFITSGDYWEYDDEGVYLSQPDEWKEGFGSFGHGRDDVMTTVSYGPYDFSKYNSTIFRRYFEAGDPGKYESLTARVLVDDGAVLSLNGQEVCRINLPAGLLGPSTLAEAEVRGDDERTYFEWPLDVTALVEGENLFWADVRLASWTSPDMAFDVALSGKRSDWQYAGGVKWRQRSGPGEARFADDSNLATEVWFDRQGTYVLELDVLDSGFIDEVTVTVDPGMSFAEWMDGFEVPAREPLADPDGDGLVNLLEFGLGSDPARPSQNHRPRVRMDGAASRDFLFSYRRLKEIEAGDRRGETGRGAQIYGIRYWVEISSDLGEWQPAGEVMTMSEAGDAVDQGDETEMVTVRLAPPGGVNSNWFMRLRIEQMFMGRR